ncbi:unnamed protein product [Rotaria socialis]|uniref:Caffeoyl-CoA O-methyltransferase n=1 Tax=Rotaria socialis TaxID=392032 RepID=A0A819YL61_9BILA|nr:unnamed protein product [Rotaria socialis]
MVAKSPITSKYSCQCRENVAGGQGDGSSLNQLSSPFGVYVDDNQTIFITDLGNDRIVQRNYDAALGQVVADGNGQGNQRVMRRFRQHDRNQETIIDNIDYTQLAIDNQKKFYASNCDKQEAYVSQVQKNNEDCGVDTKQAHITSSYIETFVITIDYQSMTFYSKIQKLGDPISQYIYEHSLHFTTEQLELIEYTKSLPEHSQMLGSLDEAQFFQVLIRLMNCKRCIEIGTFTGYTSMAIALALPSDGKLVTCDIDDQYIRQDLWAKAGVRDKISLRVGPAIETLEKLIEEYGEGSFDFVFIDADKVNYLEYYKLSMRLLRSNGLIAVDNTLWGGRVVDETDTSEQTVAIRTTNDFIRDDQRVDISFLRLGDGTTLCRKK